MYGAEFEGAVLAAQILLVAMVAFGVKQTLYNGVRGQGYPEIPFYAELVGTLVTGIGLYLLLEPIGIEGASVTSLLAYGSSFVVAYVIFRRGWGMRGG
jgi:O-antigen/teichoic acid export membrane protein